MPFSTNISPKCFQLTAQPGTTYQDNAIVFPGVAVFAQIYNKSMGPVSVRLNADPDATFTLDGSTTQVFNSGEVHLISVAFDNSTSGAKPVIVEVIVGVVA